jgi:hypothetical protein
MIRGDKKVLNEAQHRQRYSHEAHRIGPHSRRHNLAKVDGRTKEANLMRSVRDELTLHVGGKPSAVQRALIERAVWLSLRLAQLDRKIASGRDFTQIDSNTHLAWNNSLTRTLARLGIEPQANGSRQSLDEIIAELEGIT